MRQLLLQATARLKVAFCLLMRHAAQITDQRWLGLTAGGAYTAPPVSLTGIKGHTSNGRGRLQPCREGKGRRGRGKQGRTDEGRSEKRGVGEGKGVEGTPCVFVNFP